jgi:hypothetical protein
LTAGPSGASIIGTLPTDVGISGGLTPTATPPRGWLGPWTDPVAPHVSIFPLLDGNRALMSGIDHQDDAAGAIEHGSYMEYAIHPAPE